MPDEREIRAAERSLTARRVREHATEREWTSLVWASLKRAGINLLELTEQAERERNGEPVPQLPFDPEALATLSAPVRLRSDLGLPRSECVVPDPPPEADHCECLSETLDGSAETLTRAGVIKVARQAHKERWDFLKRKPKSRPQPPQPRQLSDRASKPAPGAAAPSRELVTETRTRPFRVVKRTPKWFEPPSQSIIDRQF
jgi:hypothetical protein